jgi:polyribonucleotide nucleotidyltransferase
MSVHIAEKTIAGRRMTLETGRLAKQASGAVLVTVGDTVVLCTVTVSPEPKPLDFFPLTVNYEERLYAVGKIPGGFIKREGRPSEKAILAGRLIDRPMRPLFPEGFRHDVQVVVLVLSVDQNNSPEMAAMTGVSAALSLSPVPFMGPVGGVVVGRIDGQFVANPTVEQEARSDVTVVVAGTQEAIMMVEAEAQQVDEDVMIEAILFGHAHIREMIDVQNELIASVAPTKMEYVLAATNADIAQAVKTFAKDRLDGAVRIADKQARQEAIHAIEQETLAWIDEQYASVAERRADAASVLHGIVKNHVRTRITHDKVRPDGRAASDIRPLSCDVAILPRTHGSGLFTRGQTQALSVCTLGALGDEQILDGLGLEESKRFMHHYNFPPFSVGEARPLRPPGRREVGHGALGERALAQVLPTVETFPYTIRVVSEVLESNGSTSQASICAASMALMDAGVPIAAPVAGIAMGLVKDGAHYTILSDIQGMEDHLGDMDFKVAGTERGVTAIQMDIKIAGIDRTILQEALHQAREGRLLILAAMDRAIRTARPQLSPYAPKIVVMTIHPDKIRDVIGAGGKVINKIIEETGVKIDIEQDGRVFISSVSDEQNARAKSMIEGIVKDIVVGEVFMGKVKRIEKFGAFVELISGKEGLVHISQLSTERIAHPDEVVAIGDSILVQVTEIDGQGRVNLSRKAVLLAQTKVDSSRA